MRAISMTQKAKREKSLKKWHWKNVIEENIQAQFLH